MRYTRQIYRVDENNKALVGLCNVATMVNLLNRKCILQQAEEFTIEDVIAQVSSVDLGICYEEAYAMVKNCGPLTEETDAYGVECDGYSYRGDTAKVYRMTYEKNGLSYRLHAVEKPSLLDVKKLLSEHPEGLFAYFYYNQKEAGRNFHAVLLTRITEDNRIWIVDPMSLYGADFDEKVGQELRKSWLYSQAGWPLTEKNKLIRIAYIE